MQLFPNSGATVGLDETMSAKKKASPYFYNCWCQISAADV